MPKPPSRTITTIINIANLAAPSLPTNNDIFPNFIIRFSFLLLSFTGTCYSLFCEPPHSRYNGSSSPNSPPLRREKWKPALAIPTVSDLSTHTHTMPIRNIAVGRPEEATQADTLKAGLAEFISTLIFVFAGEGSGMAFNKLTSDGATTPAGLISASIAHAFALFVAVSVGANISGGHVNPAVTFGAFIGGNITLLRGIVYWIAQLLGSTVACLLLKFVTGGLTTPAFALSSGVGVWNAVVFEIVMTFGLVYTVYATAVDPKKGNLGVIAPIAIGFIVGANILAGGAFDGASMNPAVSFGPALVSWSWNNHWVYWVGPLIGGGLAGLIYEVVFISHSHEQLPSTDY